MRFLSNPFALATVAAAAIFFSNVALSDENADIEAVEREIRAVNDSIAIHNRAKKRAKVAVRKSSWGIKCFKRQSEYRKENEAFKISKAYREYLGPDKFDRIGFKKEWIKKHGSSNYIKMLDEANKESDMRRKRFEEAQKPIDALYKVMVATQKVCASFVRRMTEIFLQDEIKKATKKKLHRLKRELEKIRKGYTRI
ncbi:MAG: hypothetical protein OXC10_18835 [Rhodospirillaceae bacterium]|nr:hypothetical protein [Rhodospirillaceae bacterium]